MKKKLIALLAGCAVAVSLAACGGGAGGKDASAGGSTPAQEKESEPANDDAGDDAGAGDDMAGDDMAGDAGAGDDMTGDDAQQADGNEEAGSDAGAEGDSSNLLAVLSQLDMIAPTEELIGTTWSFAGGMVDGVEMGDEEVASSLEMYGGTMNVVFEDAENISLIQGGGTLAGVYGMAADQEYLMQIVFDNGGSDLPYAGLLANVDGQTVLMLFSDATGNNAMYFVMA